LADTAPKERATYRLSGHSIEGDRRTTPIRGDLADIKLAGKLFAPHYAVPMLRTGIAPVTEIHAEPASVVDAGQFADAWRGVCRARHRRRMGLGPIACTTIISAICALPIWATISPQPMWSARLPTLLVTQPSIKAPGARPLSDGCADRLRRGQRMRKIPGLRRRLGSGCASFRTRKGGRIARRSCRKAGGRAL
jgi:hypothetical protein